MPGLHNLGFNREWVREVDKGELKVLIPEEGYRYVSEDDTRKAILKILWFYGYLAGSSLGSLGSFKLAHDRYGDVIPTKKIYKIIDSVSRENPIVEVIWEHARSLWRVYGDGVKTSLVLAYKLYERGYRLIKEYNLSPSLIVDGYREALRIHLKTLEDLAGRTGPIECINAAQSLLWGAHASGKLASHLCSALTRYRRECGWLHDLVIVERVEGGSVEDTHVIPGVVLRKTPMKPGAPRRLRGVKVAILNEKLYVDLRYEGYRFISSPDIAYDIRRYIIEEAKKIANFIKDLSIGLLVNLKGVDMVIEDELEKMGVTVIRRIPEDKLAPLARAVGARVVNKLEDLREEALGWADLVEERVYGDRRFMVISREDSCTTTIVLRGPWYAIDSMYDEVRMAVRGLETWLTNKLGLPAGGAPEVEASIRIKEAARRVGGKKQLAFEAYAEALEVIPQTLARHSGLDPIEAVTYLEKLHYEGLWAAGINEYSRKISSDVIKDGLYDIYTIRRRAVEAAVELATTLLRVSGISVSNKGAKLRTMRYNT